MKKSLLALSLGLLSATGMSSAFANGTINFEGRITQDTCPIDVRNPNDGSSSSVVKMGTVPAVKFTATGQEYAGKGFSLVIPDIADCKGATNEANVMFSGASSTGDYFDLNPGNDSAKNVVIAVRDVSNGLVKPGVPTADTPLAASGETIIPFMAYYRSTANSVEAGVASADVSFTVNIL
ncbi:fimbrial protein [Pseudomonas sp. NBRC 111130]|uniref:fimbrial protein n=1 Tax=Pseudomonas sp. NBRC 111130 TaxID=1661045 RepID=UPI0006D4086A|nr:fimbrial protein [Pseudomonas sp. NBRC 111130]